MATWICDCTTNQKVQSSNLSHCWGCNILSGNWERDTETVHRHHYGPDAPLCLRAGGINLTVTKMETIFCLISLYYWEKSERLSLWGNRANEDFHPVHANTVNCYLVKCHWVQSSYGPTLYGLTLFGLSTFRSIAFLFCPTITSFSDKLLFNHFVQKCKWIMRKRTSVQAYP